MTIAHPDGAVAAQPADERLIDPLAFRFTVRLCKAIEQFTAAEVEHDALAFGRGLANLRYALERHLYFALVNDDALYAAMAAHEAGARAVPDGLSPLAQEIAPYLLNAPKPALGRRLGVVTRFVRGALRQLWQPALQHSGTEAASAEILFLVIQEKFVAYLKPIADHLGRPYAFLVYDDAALYQQLVAAGHSVIHVQPTARSKRLAWYGARYGAFEWLFVQYSALRRALRRQRARCVVIPEGNAPLYEIVNRAARAGGIGTLCLQQGWSPIIHSGFRNLGYITMCIWGDGFERALRPFNPQQRFFATGHHLLTLRRMEEGPPRRALTYFLQKGSRLITDAAWRGMLDLVRWSALRFPENEIRVREHPSAPLSAEEIAALAGLPNLKFMAAKDATLDHVLEGCRVSVAIFSSTILETVACGGVPLIVNVTGMPRYEPDVAAQGAAIEVQDFAAARVALQRLMENDEAYAAFAPRLDPVRHDYFARGGIAALDAIADEIRALAGPAPA